jgi:hypothetical protein
VPHGDKRENFGVHKGSNLRLCHCRGVPREGEELVYWFFKGVCEHSYQDSLWRNTLEVV